MELNIVEKNEKILLSRTEVKATVSFTGAVPSTKDVKKSIASQLKADAKLVVVKNIYPKFKDNSADVLAYYYISEEEMKKNEPKLGKKAAEKLKKSADEKTKPAEKLAEAPKKEAPAEKPAEEKKEEPAKEEKKEAPKEEKPEDKKE